MTWGMLFNAEKSEHLAISNGNKEQLSSPSSARLKMVDAELPVVERHRHLSLIINKALSWGDHIDEVIISCGRKFGMLIRLMYIVDNDSIRQFLRECDQAPNEICLLHLEGGQYFKIGTAAREVLS